MNRFIEDHKKILTLIDGRKEQEAAASAALPSKPALGMAALIDNMDKAIMMIMDYHEAIGFNISLKKQGRKKIHYDLDNIKERLKEIKRDQTPSEGNRLFLNDLSDHFLPAYGWIQEAKAILKNLQSKREQGENINPDPERFDMNGILTRCEEIDAVAEQVRDFLDAHRNKGENDSVALNAIKEQLQDFTLEKKWKERQANQDYIKYIDQENRTAARQPKSPNGYQALESMAMIGFAGIMAGGTLLNVANKNGFYPSPKSHTSDPSIKRPVEQDGQQEPNTYLKVILDEGPKETNDSRDNTRDNKWER